MTDRLCEKKIRISRDRLTVSGTGILMLAGWSLLKIIMMFTIRWEDTEKILIDGMIERGDSTMVPMTVTVVILEALICSACVYIGLSARSTGLGGRLRLLSILVDVILGVVIGYSMVTEIVDIAALVTAAVGDPNVKLSVAESAFFEVIVDATMVFLTAEILYFSGRLFRLSGSLAGKHREI